jgi:hypothetical protein
MMRVVEFMGRYFDLVDKMDIQGRWLLGKPMDAQGGKVDHWQFIEGQRLEGRPASLSFRQRVPGNPLDYSEASISIPVVSQRLKELLERLGVEDEVQFFPARVESREEPYFVLNATRLVDCIDEARCSRTVRWKPEDGHPDRVGEYRVVEDMRIDPGRVGGVRIFRTWGWPVLIVSEQLKRAMEQEGITGTRFTEV